MASDGECSDLVGLNVGGTIYRTSSSTLLKNQKSFFSKMLAGDIPSKKDDKGNFLIDRDGQVFRHILNSMRYGKLVVPEDFKEYTLLEREAAFYSLEELQKAVQEAVSPQAVSFVVVKQGETGCKEILFRVTKKALSREDNSLFSKILRGEAAFPRDSQGNYLVIERDGSLFNYVRIYQEKGTLFSYLDKQQLANLQEEAAHFQLGVLECQIESIVALQQFVEPNSLQIHVYWWVNGPCVVFQKELGECKNNEWKIGELCNEETTICEDVLVGVIKKGEHVESIETIVEKIRQKSKADFMKFDVERPNINVNYCVKAIMKGFQHNPMNDRIGSE